MDRRRGRVQRYLLQWGDSEMNESTPNPQAVEAALALSYTCETCGGSGELISCDRDGEFSVACHVCKGEEMGPEFERDQVERILQAAEPHIRSQLLTELAEWCEERTVTTLSTAMPLVTRNRELGRADAMSTVANHCRELAAKEKDRL